MPKNKSNKQSTLLPQISIVLGSVVVTLFLVFLLDILAAQMKEWFAGKPPYPRLAMLSDSYNISDPFDDSEVGTTISSPLMSVEDLLPQERIVVDPAIE